MGLFDTLKKKVESLSTMAKMDDFLIAEIDRMITEEWRKVSERKPLSVGGVSLEKEAEYNFIYDTPKGIVHVEMEHEFPYVEVEMKIGKKKVETRLKVSDFVERNGTELRLKNREALEKIVRGLMQRI